MIGREIQVTLGQPLSFLQQQEHQVIITTLFVFGLAWISLEGMNLNLRLASA